MSHSDLQSSAAVVREKAQVEAAKGAVEGQAGRLTLETERLHRRAQELENEVAKLNRIIDEAKLQESRLGDRVGRLEVQSQEKTGVDFLLYGFKPRVSFTRKRKSNWKNRWLKLRSRKRRCRVPIER